MPTHLLDLPPELIEHILALLSHQDAPSLSACRQTCRALNAAIAQSPLVRYIERAALLGVYDPLVPSTPDAIVGATTTMTIPERAKALEAWNDAWTTLDEIVSGQGKESREPDVRFAMPSRDELRSGRRAEVISGPGPSSSSSSSVTEEEEGGDEEDSEEEAHCHFSFGPWFVAAAREGPGMHAGYSYLDVRAANLCAVEAEAEMGAGGRHGGRGCAAVPRWTTINVPVRNVVVFALSTELDLAVAVSCV
jgi:hypothetical protein